MTLLMFLPEVSGGAPPAPAGQAHHGKVVGYSVTAKISHGDTGYARPPTGSVPLDIQPSL